MKRHVTKFAFLFSFVAVLAFAAFAANLSAASGSDISDATKKIAYVSGKNLVLRFASFSTAKYTYEVEGNGGKVSGKVAKGGTMLTADISDIYKSGEDYTLTLTASDSGNYIKVPYYAGEEVENATAAQSGSSVAATWAVDGSADYEKFQVSVANSEDDAKFSQYLTGSAAKGSTSLTLNDPKSKLVSGKLTAYVIGLKGDAFGAGQKAVFTYVGKPSKVTTVTLTPGKSKITVDWVAARNATGYIVYVKKPGSSKYVKAKQTTKTTYTLSGAKSNKKYFFKVKSYAKGNGQTLQGAVSKAASIQLDAVPDQVTRYKFYTDPKATAVGVKWAGTKGAKCYEVWVKVAGMDDFKRYGGDVTRTAASLRYLSVHYPGKKCTFKIYAKNGNVRSKPSKEFSINPDKYLENNRKKLLKQRQEILAKKVRTIKYLPNKKYVYTTKKYTDEVKEAYVNYHGFSSKTKYLIWANLYTQQVTIYTGKKGEWKMIRTFDCASGEWNNRTPRGTHRLWKKEKVWKHPGSRTWYVSRFYKKAAFHQRPKTLGGRVWQKTMRKPVSNACIRLYDKDALFIYNKVPLGTTVRVW